MAALLALTARAPPCCAVAADRAARANIAATVICYAHFLVGDGTDLERRQAMVLP